MKLNRGGARRVLAIAATLALVSCAEAAMAATESAPFMTTRDHVYVHIATHPGSPINALSAGARERFLISLQFSPNGLAGFDPNDIADELTDEQIRLLMSSFGPNALPYAPKSRVQQARASERRAAKHAGIGAIERRYNDYYLARNSRESRDSAARTRQLGESFDAHLSALYSRKGLRRTDDHDLRLLGRAAQEVALNTILPRHVDAFESFFAERTRRGLASTHDVESLRRLYLTLHRFQEASALASTYPDAALAPLPQFEDSIADATGRATVWRLDISGKQFTRTTVDLAPLQIVITAACHFSKDAARDISKDALLGPVFAQHAQWLVQAPGQESIDAARDWNLELPNAPVAMIYDREEWRALPHWNMPTFFIIRDGQVIDSTSGWLTGDAASRDQLVTTLRRSGLLPLQ